MIRFRPQHYHVRRFITLRREFSFRRRFSPPPLDYLRFRLAGDFRIFTPAIFSRIRDDYGFLFELISSFLSSFRIWKRWCVRISLGFSFRADAAPPLSLLALLTASSIAVYYSSLVFSALHWQAHNGPSSFSSARSNRIFGLFLSFVSFYRMIFCSISLFRPSMVSIAFWLCYWADLSDAYSKE